MTKVGIWVYAAACSLLLGAALWAGLAIAATNSESAPGARAGTYPGAVTLEVTQGSFSRTARPDGTVEVTSSVDAAPPVLTGVSVAPQQINTLESSQSVQVTKSASDDLSGVAFSGTRCTGFTNGLVFTSPSGTNEVKINNCAFSLVAGSETSGDFSAMATFPQFSEKGIWRLTSVILEDQTGNTDFIGSAELAALGIVATVEVTSPGDTTPPVLTGVSVAPQQINTVESSQSVQVTKSASDDLSGVAFSGNRCTGFTNGLVFTSPSGNR